MSTTLARTREDVLAPIATAFEEAAPDGGGAEFVARYFRHVPLDELTSRTPDIYADAAASHLELARDRPAWPRCACTTRAPRSTAGPTPARSSRSSPTTCPSSSTG